MGAVTIAKEYGLDERAAELVDGIIKHGNATAAGRELGLSESQARALARQPEVIAAVHQEISRRLRVTGASLAYDTLITVMLDKSTTPNVKIECAKALLSRAGHVEPRATVSRNDTKDLSAMSRDDLAAIVSRLEAELADRAKPVNPAPTVTDSAALSPTGVGKDIDIFE